MTTSIFRPTSGSGDNWSNIANAYDNNTSTSASVSASRFNYSSRTATFTFDFSSIPEGSTILWSKIYLRYSVGKTTIEPRIYFVNDGWMYFTPSSTSTIEDYMDTSEQALDNLSSLTIRPYNSNWTNNTLVVYELWIELNYLEPSYCDVTFVDWDGTVLDIQTILQGTDAVPPSNPTRPGYKFVGWDGSYTNVRVNTTITAMYEEITSVNNIKLGNTTINNICIGNTKVTKVYIGNTLVFEN